MNNTLLKRVSYLIFSLIFVISPSVSFAGTVPTMTTTVASGVTSSVATLNGTFMSNGSTAKIRFEYGDTPLMLLPTTYQTKSSTDSGTFSATISVLPGKTYFYRAVGINTNGPGYGLPQSFTTPNIQVATLPTIITNPQTNVTSTSATLNGFFNGNGSPTTTSFEYGTSNALGSTTGLSSQLNGFGKFNDTITSLQPGTKYYFRAIATNSAGTKTGSILNFTTSGTAVTQCNDGMDNDGNGLVDYPADLGCTSLSDVTESGYNPPVTSSQCNNGYDDDLDGLVDYPQDPGCVSYTDNTEYNSITTIDCNDGMDNDGNGLVDYPADLGCTSFFDTSESGYVIQQNKIPTVSTYTASNTTSVSATLNGYVDPNGANTIRWFEYGTNLNYLANKTNSSNQWYSAGNVSENITGLVPNTTYYYKLVAQNSYGTNYGSIQSFYTSVSTSGSAPKAISTVETGTTTTTAKLHGLAMITGNVPSVSWFEYGTTTSFGHNSQIINIGSASQIDLSATIVGLKPNTLYYWKAVVQNKYGTSYGSTLVFKTKTGSILGGNSGGSTTSSYISLNINNPYKEISVGDNVDFNITYKNTSGKSFKDGVIRIMLPKEISFTKSSDGKYSKSDHAVTLIIGPIAPGQSETISVQGIAKYGNDSGIATSATIAYTGVSDNAQYDTVATTINQISGGSVLGGASIFGSGGFLPTSLAGWLLLILVIFGLVYLGRKMYTK